MATTTQPFSLTLGDGGELVAVGELDVSVVDYFWGAAASKLDPRREVVLDLADLSFIDSGGIRAIVRLAEEVCRHGLVLRSPRRGVLKVLDILGVEHFPGIRVER